MSADANDNAQSKFPRASLRARNRTIVIAPADVDDFKPEPRKTKTNIKIEDFLEDSLGTTSSVPLTAGVSSAAALDDVLSEALPDTVVSTDDNFPLSADPVATPPRDKAFTPNEREMPRHAASGYEESLAESNKFPHDEVLGEENVEQVAPIARIVRAIGSQEAAPAVNSWSSERELLDSNDPEGFDEGTHELRDSSDSYLEEVLDPQSVGHDTPSIHIGGREYAEWRRPSRLVGFLISFQENPHGSYVELHEGRLFVSCERGDVENCLIIAHPSVSSMHAILLISVDGSVLILDQLSEHGTRVRRFGSSDEQVLLGEKGTLEHGDVVIFGECAYHICILKGTEHA